MVAQITAEIVNKKGLHARAAAKFVKIVANYPAQVRVIKKTANPADEEADSPCVDGSSILGLMMLGADKNSFLHIIADGEGEEEAVAALSGLISARFGEAE